MDATSLLTNTAKAIEAAIEKMRDEEKDNIRKLHVRQQIEQNSSIERIVAAYVECWNEVMDKVEERA